MTANLTWNRRHRYVEVAFTQWLDSELDDLAVASLVVHLEGEDALRKEALARVLRLCSLIVGLIIILGWLGLTVAIEFYSSLIINISATWTWLGTGNTSHASAGALGLFVLVCEPDISCRRRSAQ